MLGTYVHLRPEHFSRNQILLDYSGWYGIINPAKYFSNRLTRMSWAMAQSLLFSVQTEGAIITTVTDCTLYYQNIVISWCFCSIMWAGQTKFPGPVWRASPTLTEIGSSWPAPWTTPGNSPHLCHGPLRPWILSRTPQPSPLQPGSNPPSSCRSFQILPRASHHELTSPLPFPLLLNFPTQRPMLQTMNMFGHPDLWQS